MRASRLGPLALAAALGAAALALGLPGAALPAAGEVLRSRFELSGGQLELLVAAGMWSGALSAAFNGFLADRFGARRALLFSAGGVVAANAALGLLFAGGWETRVLSGFAMLHAIGRYFHAFAAPAAVKLLAARGEPETRGLRAGVFGALSLSVEFLAPAAGAALLARLPWPAFFLVPAGLAAAVWLAVRALPRDAAPRAADADALLDSVPLRLLAGAEFALGFARWGLLGWAPAYLLEVHRVRPAEPGHAAAFLAAAAGAVLGPLACGRLSDLWGGRRAEPACVFLLLLAASLIALAAATGPESAALFLGLACAGAFGAHALLTGASAIDLGGPAGAGTAAGLLEGAHWAGAGLSAPVVAAFLDRGGWGVWGAALAPAALIAAVLAWTSERLGRLGR